MTANVIASFVFWSAITAIIPRCSALRNSGVTQTQRPSVTVASTLCSPWTIPWRGANGIATLPRASSSCLFSLAVYFRWAGVRALCILGSYSAFQASPLHALSRCELFQATPFALGEKTYTHASSGVLSRSGRGATTFSAFSAVVIPYCLLFPFPPLPHQGTLEICPIDIGSSTKRRATSRRFGWCDSRQISASVDTVRDRNMQNYYFSGFMTTAQPLMLARVSNPGRHPPSTDPLASSIVDICYGHASLEHSRIPDDAWHHGIICLWRDAVAIARLSLCSCSG